VKQTKSKSSVGIKLVSDAVFAIFMNYEFMTSSLTS